MYVYADRPAIELRVAAEPPTRHQLQQDVAVARPGRAYVLQRTLDKEER